MAWHDNLFLCVQPSVASLLPGISDLFFGVQTHSGHLVAGGDSPVIFSPTIKAFRKGGHRLLTLHIWAALRSSAKSLTFSGSTRHGKIDVLRGCLEDFACWNAFYNQSAIRAFLPCELTWNPKSKKVGGLLFEDSSQNVSFSSRFHKKQQLHVYGSTDSMRIHPGGRRGSQPTTSSPLRRLRAALRPRGARGGRIAGPRRAGAVGAAPRDSRCRNSRLD